MTFPLAYPLGGAAGRTNYEQEIKQRIPPWLRRRVGGGIMMAIGAVVDALAYRMAQGVALRFPFQDEDSLAIIGRERAIVRGPSEHPIVYSARVQGWLGAHRHRGSAWELLRQWKAYNGTDAYDAGTGQQIDVIYQSGTAYRLDNVGNIERFIPGWGGHPPPGGWAQAWCFLYVAADPTPVSAEDDAIMAAIPRLWSAAHMLPLNVIVVWPGARLWAYPPPELTWDEQEALYTWDELVPHRVT